MNHEEAKRFKRNTCKRLDRLKLKFYNTQDEDESLDLSMQMTSLAADLHSTLEKNGWRISQMGEKYAGRVIPVTEEWLKEEKAKLRRANRFMKKVREGDQKAILAYLRALDT